MYSVKLNLTCNGLFFAVYHIIRTDVVLKMTLPQIALITAVLLWRPVFMKKPPESVCPPDGLSLSVLHAPPFITVSHSGQVEGLLGEYFSLIIQRCFTHKCKSFSYSIRPTIFNSTESFISTIRENKTDVAFPLSRPLMMSLSGRRDSTEPQPVTFETFMISPGYSLIMDVEHVNDKVSELELNSLFENSWPIVVFTLLIAGISGMVVWILVSRTVILVPIERFLIAS